MQHPPKAQQGGLSRITHHVRKTSTAGNNILLSFIVRERAMRDELKPALDVASCTQNKIKPYIAWSCFSYYMQTASKLNAALLAKRASFAAWWKRARYRRCACRAFAGLAPGPPPGPLDPDHACFPPSYNSSCPSCRRRGVPMVGEVSGAEERGLCLVCLE